MPASTSLDKHPGLDDWLSVGADGRITVRSGKVDIGQRISTAIALLAAEELDVDLGRIDVARTETGAAPDEGITSGSNSMDESGNAVRLAAATLRHHLLALAARHLDVDAASLEIDDGLIQSRATNRSVTYWELAGGKPFGIPVDAAAALKAPGQLRQIGRRVVARDMEAIVTGKPHFVQDVKLPNMLHARVVRPPHYHARLESIDSDVTDRLADQGAQVVRDGSFLAVAAEDEYVAIKAAERLFAAAEWRLGDGLEPMDVFERLTSNERVSLPVVDGVPQRDPVPELGPPPAEAAQTISARYERAYQMHGSIGPSAAVALFENGRLKVWTHSQGIYVLRQSMAEALDMAPDDLTLIHVPGAGCYGHNGADDVGLDAALAARAIPGRPVMLKWTREDEHAWEPYGSCMTMDLRASLDADGRVLAWSHESFSDTYNMRPRPGPDKIGPSRLLATRYLADPLPPPVPQPAMARHVGIHRNIDPLYNFADRRLVKHLVRGLPLRTSALRALGAYANVFAIESFMDELAAAAGRNPIEFRLDHLDDDRAADVVRAAAKCADGWDKVPGRGRGFAFAQYKNIAAYAAVGLEVEVTDAAEIRLHRAVIAADAGQIVDPEGLTAQLEGGLIQAASWTLHEQVQYDRGGITSRDWDSYPILRFDNIPRIETILLDRPDAPFLGSGEATAGPTAAAIANAVRDATGLSMRRIPFTPDAVRAAAMDQ
jgi:CO/xanthine dehydrogenase Mo-binding subunit